MCVKFRKSSGFLDKEGEMDYSKVSPQYCGHSNHELPRHSTNWPGRLTRKDVFRVGVRCGSVETCHKGWAASLRPSEAD